MADGYIGLRSRRRRRYQLLFFLFILVIGLIIFFSFNNKNINVDKLETTDEVFNKANTDVVRKLESKIFEKDQKLELLRNVITPLRTQIDFGSLYNRDILLSTKPQEGKLVVWPNYLMHGSYPYTGEKNRIIVSVNALVSLLKENKPVKSL